MPGPSCLVLLSPWLPLLMGSQPASSFRGSQCPRGLAQLLGPWKDPRRVKGSPLPFPPSSSTCKSGTANLSQAPFHAATSEAPEPVGACCPPSAWEGTACSRVPTRFLFLHSDTIKLIATTPAIGTFYSSCDKDLSCYLLSVTLSQSHWKLRALTVLILQRQIQVQEMSADLPRSESWQGQGGDRSPQSLLPVPHGSRPWPPGEWGLHRTKSTRWAVDRTTASGDALKP